MMKKRLVLRPAIGLILLLVTISMPIFAQAKDNGSVYGYSNLGICDIAESYIGIYEKTSTDSKVVGYLPKNACCDVIYNSGDWIYISSGDIDGFVPAKAILVGNSAWDKASKLSEYIITARGNNTKVRKSNNAKSKVVYTLAENEALSVVDETQDNKWIKVEISDGIFGYVGSEYVTVNYTLKSAITEEQYLKRSDTLRSGL